MWTWSETWPCEVNPTWNPTTSQTPSLCLHFPLRDGPVARLFDRNSSADFKLAIYFSLQQRWPHWDAAQTTLCLFTDSHDSTTTLIPSYCSFSMLPQLHHSQKSHWRRKNYRGLWKGGRRNWGKEITASQEKLPFIAFVIKVLAQKQPFLSMKSYLGHNFTVAALNLDSEDK